ncbi:DUF262 domain-containing protein [Janibacter limosus]|uniref:DUF262 domain-containing protein n=1 Tax=Janibacter limosus TaxID=53458 RepID=UPI000832430A|nr:DUF262 domain-containing protein [Janibacter limosus]
MAKLDTDYGTFKDLMSAAKVHQVPQYQRRYSWSAKKQIQALWGDIVRLYRERAEYGRPHSSHFIGSLVVGETASKSLGPGACDIIDGQQRLTTLSLLLVALRDGLVEDSFQKAQISDNFLTFSGGKDLRLVLSHNDHAVYEALVHGEDVEDKTSLVFKGYKYFRDELEKGLFPEADPDEELADSDDSEVDATEADDSVASDAVEGLASEPWDWETLLAVIATDLELVSISGVPAERAYQIFATLNHGGLSLSQVDLIRNAVFMKLPKLHGEAYVKIWQPLEAKLGERGLGRFLHAWVVRRGHNVPQKDTYASVLEELKKVPSEKGIFNLLKQLSEEADVFNQIANANSYETKKLAESWKMPQEMRRALRFLQSWGNVPAQAALMEVLVRWRKNELSVAKATDLVLMVESLLVRRFIAQVPPNDLRSTLARLVVQVAPVSSGSFYSAFLSALSEPTRRWSSADDVRDGFVTRPFYRAKSLRQTFLILKRLAEEAEGKESPQIEHGKSATSYSIEHVLPQTVDGTSWLSDMEGWGDDDPHNTWNTRRHTIGNLTLTAYNSELSNKSFTEKKAWISNNSYLKLSKEIAGHDDWTGDRIEARSEALSDLALEIWKRHGE